MVLNMLIEQTPESHVVTGAQTLNPFLCLPKSKIPIHLLSFCTFPSCNSPYLFIFFFFFFFFFFLSKILTSY